MWRNIGCMGWVVISICAVPIILFLWIVISSLQYKAELEEGKRQADLKEQQQIQEAARIEKIQEEEKREENKTKKKLTKDMIYNKIGNTVDLFGVQINVSNPYETTLEEPDEETRIRVAQKKSQVVSFNVRVQNNSRTPVDLEHYKFKLERDSFSYDHKKVGVKRAYQAPKEEDAYYYRQDVFNRESSLIQPGETMQGTISYFIDSVDIPFVNANIAKGEGDFTLILDVSGMEFLHSFEENKIFFDLHIERDSYYNKLIFSEEE